jgi:hypothetical protein
MNSTTLDRRADGLPVGAPTVSNRQITRKMIVWQGSGLAFQLAIIAVALVFAVMMIVAAWSQGDLTQGLLGAGGGLLAAGGAVAYSRRRATAQPYPTNSYSVALETALKKVDATLRASRPIAERRALLQDLVPVLNEAFATFFGRRCSTIDDTPLLSSDYERPVPVEVQYRRHLERLSWLNRPRTVRHEDARTIGADCLTSYRRAMRNMGVNIDILEAYGVPSTTPMALSSPTASVSQTITPIYLANLGARLGAPLNSVLPPLRQKLNRCLAAYGHMTEGDQIELDAIINRHLPAIEGAFVDKAEKGTEAEAAANRTVQAIARIDATLDDLLARSAKGADDSFSTIIGFVESRHPNA